MPEHGVWSELRAGELRGARAERQGCCSAIALRKLVAARLRSVCDLLPPLPYDELHNDLATLPGDGGRGKHVDQERSLVSHALRIAPAEGSRVWIDMGGGRGCLSERLLHATGGQDTHFVVDWNPMHRARVRDAAMRARTTFRRIVADIGTVDLEAEVAAVKSTCDSHTLLAMSKHLCGCATDLAMRQIPPRCSLLMAPCCHHLCTWESYQGRSFLEALGVTLEEFNVLCNFAPWASVDGDSASLDEQVQDSSALTPALQATTWKLPFLGSLEERWRCHFEPSNLASVDIESPKAKRLLGRQSKLLLDVGRVHALSLKYANVRFVRYTRRSVEDRLIVAF
eukprot:TRINITY_DN40730_c0_g1_i1.p1 TRINITY_DN40730_c0_g1~~TRINITY_DN40730_c0_g1_i1.p1  ORF type:complete len:340 (-),score=45.76 TRINITY_DN40730_c0_g1_i1:31-1050(-)